MSRPSAFVLPEHVDVTVGTSSLAIRHGGDVVLEQTLGRRLGLLEAGGDVTLRGARFHGTVRAGGRVLLQGDFDGEEIRADEIEIDAVSLRARAVVARTRVVVRRVNLAVDVIVAPEVHIDAAATGRVRVVDCLNDRPPTKVRGCLSLEDYEADLGGVAEFLERRGVEPVSPLPPLRDESLEDTAELGAVQVEPEELASGEIEAIDDAVEAAADVAVTTFEVDEAPRARAGGPSRTARQVEKAWERLSAAYAGLPLPQDVARVGAMIAEGRAEGVPDAIDDLWMGTLREHLGRGVAPPRKAVLAFHALRAART